jgi:hypothetical protein
MKTRSLLLFLFAASTATTLDAQGPLTPPGPPAPTMKTLDQLEPRTRIKALPFTISSPGPYYLTGNLSAAAAARNRGLKKSDAPICP